MIIFVINVTTLPLLIKQYNVITNSLLKKVTRYFSILIYMCILIFFKIKNIFFNN